MPNSLARGGGLVLLYKSIGGEMVPLRVLTESKMTATRVWQCTFLQNSLIIFVPILSLHHKGRQVSEYFLKYILFAFAVPSASYIICCC